MTGSGVALRQTLAQWFESQREAYLDAARMAEIAPSVPLRVAVATKAEEHSATIEHEIRTASPLLVADLAWTLGRIVEETSSEHAPASEVLAFFGEGAVPWGHSFARSASQRKAIHLLTCLGACPSRDARTLRQGDSTDGCPRTSQDRSRAPASRI